MAHLTHVSEMEKKIETLARITTILKDVIQNKVTFLLSFCHRCHLDLFIYFLNFILFWISVFLKCYLKWCMLHAEAPCLSP